MFLEEHPSNIMISFRPYAKDDSVKFHPFQLFGTFCFIFYTRYSFYNRDLRIHVYRKQLSSDTFFAIKTKSWTVKSFITCSIYNYSKDKKMPHRDTCLKHIFHLAKLFARTDKSERFLLVPSEFLCQKILTNHVAGFLFSLRGSRTKSPRGK